MYMQILRGLGYTEREIKVYNALLELGKSTAGPISSRSKLSHTKVYDTLQRLVEKGLVSYITISKTKHFLAENPQEILNKFDEKRNLVKDAVEELEVKRKFSEEKQEAVVHEGMNALRALFNKIILNLNKKDYYYGFALKEQFREDSAPNFLSNFHIKLAAKGIETKIIANKEFKSDILEAFKDNQNIKFKFIKENTPVGIIIIKGKVIQIIWSKLPTAIEISSPQLHKYYEEYFEEMWKNKGGSYNLA